jgi:heterodisulfide reductase subunit A-like polyferredoxin
VQNQRCLSAFRNGLSRQNYVISPQIIGTEDAKPGQEACKYDAVDLEMEAKTVDLPVGAIVWATGWEPYDANRIDNLGFGQYDNIITNMMLERLAAPNPVPPGKIVRPSDDKAPESVAFVQCAGSRDENHLPYCSYICCMASLKHATYIREQYPDTKIYIFYIDIRSPGDRYEKFYNKIKEDENVFLIKGQSRRGQRRSGHQEHHRGCRKCGHRGKNSPDGGDGRSGYGHAAHRRQRQTACRPHGQR